MTNIKVKICPSDKPDMGPWWFYAEWATGPDTKDNKLIRNLPTREAAVAHAIRFLANIE